jgi:regulator of sirC expression with transglutaminase-like and TPR domain
LISNGLSGIENLNSLMNPMAVTSDSSGFTETQQLALLTLLGDEDPKVWQAVRGKILACGPPAEPWLRPHALSQDPATRRRVQEILHHLARHKADNRFMGFCLAQGEDFPLEEAVWLLAQTAYPEINVQAYQAQLDGFAEELGRELDGVAPGRDTLRTFNQHLFRQLRFHGNEEDYYHPDNSYLNCVIDRRTGNPISLCMVYLFLARRLHLPVAGIAMPGHFICRYQSSTETIYIDAFHRGRILTKADCVRYLQQSSYGSLEGVLSPASPRRTLVRMCSNLHQIYLQLRLKSETARLQRYVVALSK